MFCCANKECKHLEDHHHYSSDGTCASCGHCYFCGKVLFANSEKCTHQAFGNDDCDICCKCEVCPTYYCKVIVYNKELNKDERCSNCRKCKECCECSHCSYCGEPEDTCCSNCDQCEDHCRCFICNGCDKTRDSGYQCSSCEYCENCCSCPDEGWISPKKNAWHGKTGRYMGVEIEVDSGDKNAVTKTIQKWGAGLVQDGSLSDEGFEITTAPARGHEFLDQIKEITNDLAVADAKITRSCGLHVHVDARDLKFYEIRKILNYYAAIEPALYAILPKWRRNSKYCVPNGKRFAGIQLNKHKKLRHDVHKVCYQTTNMQELPDRKKHKYDDARYFGFNLHSWFYRGTIEFRHFGGSIECRKITNWARLCCAIIEYSAFAKDSDIDNLNYDEPAKNLEKAMLLAGNDVYEWVLHRWFTMYSSDIENVKNIKSMRDVGVY